MKTLKFTPVLLFVLLLSNFSYSQTGWQRLNQNNSITQNLLNIEILDGNNFYLLADSGYFMKSLDGGLNILSRRLNFTPSAISFININTGYASCKDILYKTINGGLDWDTLYRYFPNMQSAYCDMSILKFTSENFGYFYINENVPLVNEGCYMVTTNGGLNWIKAASTYSAGTSSGWSTSSVLGINIFSNGNGFSASYGATGSFGHITSEQYGFAKTTNYGVNWIDVMPSTNVTRIANIDFINSSLGYAISDSNKILKTNDGGFTWNFINFTPQNSGSKFFMIDGNNGYLHNAYNEYYRTTDGCQTWNLQTVNMNGSQQIGEIAFLNPQIGYIVGKQGQIFKTTTGGNVSIGNLNSELADKYSLSQNYPNPFNPETKIQFSIPKNGLVRIVVYDLLGREAMELVNEFKQQGSYNISFNGANLSSGIYFYKLITDDFVETKKMILTK
jgi:hypothetical protein